MGQPHHQLFVVGGVCRGHCVALYCPLHGCLFGLGHWLACLAGLAGVSRHGIWHGLALHGHHLEHRLGQAVAAPWRMDANFQAIHGVSNVCHGGLAGVGFGAASWSRWRHWIFGLLVELDLAHLGFVTSWAWCARHHSLGFAGGRAVHLAVGPDMGVG